MPPSLAVSQYPISGGLGTGGACTVTAAVSVATRPSSSATVRVAVRSPGVVYECDGDGPWPEVPSPKSHEWVKVWSGAEAGAPSKATSREKNGCVYGPPASATICRWVLPHGPTSVWSLTPSRTAATRKAYSPGDRPLIDVDVVVPETSAASA